MTTYPFAFLAGAGVTWLLALWIGWWALPVVIVAAFLIAVVVQL